MHTCSVFVPFSLKYIYIFNSINGIKWLNGIIEIEIDDFKRLVYLSPNNNFKRYVIQTDLECKRRKLSQKYRLPIE